MQLRRAGQAAKNAGDAKKEARVRRLLTMNAKFAARLGFSSPTAYEDWLSRGSPEDELPPAVQVEREAALKEVPPPVPASPAPIKLVEPPSEDPIKPVVEVSLPRRSTWSRNPWEAMAERAMAETEDEEPFATGRSPQRRAPGGYFSH
jgi:hypothetical protein